MTGGAARSNRRVQLAWLGPSVRRLLESTGDALQMTEPLNGYSAGCSAVRNPTSRWTHAQEVERRYWDSITPKVLFGILASFSEFLDGLGESRLDALFGERDVLELGVGPLGLSVTALWPDNARIRRLVKIEPLAVVSIGETPAGSAAWAAPVLAWMDGLAQQGVQVQLPAEAVEYQREFDTVVTYNVLDHVDNPHVVVRKAYEALRPGGMIVVGVDCRSILGKLRFDHILRRTRRGTILVDAHPFTFRPSDVERILKRTGFREVITLNAPGPTRWLVGGSFRATLIAKR